MSVNEYIQRMRETRPQGWTILVGLGGCILILLIFLWGWNHFPILSIAVSTAVIIFVIHQLVFGKESARELFRKKRIIVREIQFAETAFFKRNINETTYLQLISKKNKELIEIDARIEQFLEKQAKKSPENIVLGEIALHKKYQLKELQDQLDRLHKEEKLTTEKFERRKVDAKTYHDLCTQNSEQQIHLNAQIKELYSDEEISETVSTVKKCVRELKRETKKPTQAQLKEIADSLVEQERERKNENP